MMEAAAAVASFGMPEPIAAAINEVMKKAKSVEKRGRNAFHGYDFAKVEDLLAELQPAMADAGLFIIQSEHDTTLLADGRLIRIQYAFKLAHKSGAVWRDPILHSGAAGVFTPKNHLDDKCVNKCHTAARKYFLLGLTQIPVGNMPDTDADDAPGNDGARGPKQQPKERPAQNGAGAAAAPRNAEPARGGYGRQKNNVDAVGPSPSGVIAAPAGDPTAETLWNGLEHTGEQAGREGLGAIVHRIKQTTKQIQAGWNSDSFPPEHQPAALDAAYRDWEAWYQGTPLSDDERAKVHKAMDAYSKAAKAMDAALLKAKRKADAEAAGADPDTGVLQYETEEAA